MKRCLAVVLAILMLLTALVSCGKSSSKKSKKDSEEKYTVDMGWSASRYSEKKGDGKGYTIITNAITEDEAAELVELLNSLKWKSSDFDYSASMFCLSYDKNHRIDYYRGILINVQTGKICDFSQFSAAKADQYRTFLNNLFKKYYPDANFGTGSGNVNNGSDFDDDSAAPTFTPNMEYAACRYIDSGHLSWNRKVITEEDESNLIGILNQLEWRSGTKYNNGEYFLDIHTNNGGGNYRIDYYDYVLIDSERGKICELSQYDYATFCEYKNFFNELFRKYYPKYVSDTNWEVCQYSEKELEEGGYSYYPKSLTEDEAIRLVEILNRVEWIPNYSDFSESEYFFTDISHNVRIDYYKGVLIDVENDLICDFQECDSATFEEYHTFLSGLIKKYFSADDDYEGGVEVLPPPPDTRWRACSYTYKEADGSGYFYEENYITDDETAILEEILAELKFEWKTGYGDYSGSIYFIYNELNRIDYYNGVLIDMSTGCICDFDSLDDATEKTYVCFFEDLFEKYYSENAYVNGGEDTNGGYVVKTT